jgi:nucleotide-binding universal stress UspA family protein
MKKILLPADGSANSLKAARYVISRLADYPDIEAHLLHVRQPFSQHIARFSRAEDRAAFHREAAEKALAPVRALLTQAGIPHVDHVELGDRAQTIHRVAQELRVSSIVMGTARKNSITRLLEDSVTAKVLELTDVPVEIVVGEEVSKLERIGVPAGFAAVLALVFFAVE